MTVVANLNALGMVTCLGSNSGETLAGIEQCSRKGFVSRSDLRDGSAVVGEVTSALPPLERFPAEFATRNNQLAAVALEQIEPAIREAMDRYGPARVGIVIGSSTSGIREGGKALAHYETAAEFPQEFRYSQQEIGNPSSYLRWALGSTGPAYTVSTACTSGAKAMAAGARLIQAGLCDAVITGGVDSLCELTVRGFTALESVSAQGCNPFSVNRDGITIGEGAAFFLMSRDEGPVRLSGWGESLDAHHISAPDPAGGGAEKAISEALQLACVQAADIGYINLHGTGTPKNDHMEAGVVNRVFGAATPASSAKGMLGHTLGAAGAIEAGLCWMLLNGDSQYLLPHAWDGCVDPSLAKIWLCDRNEDVAGLRHVMSNSFAFGGSNAVLVLSRQ